MIARTWHKLILIVLVISMTGCLGNKDIPANKHAHLISILRDAEAGAADKEMALKELKARYYEIGWSMQALERVIQGEIWEGMIKEQLVESLGKPTDIKKEVKLNGVQESWTYDTVPGANPPKYKVVYLEKNAVTTWQT